MRYYETEYFNFGNIWRGVYTIGAGDGGPDYKLQKRLLLLCDQQFVISKILLC